MERIEGCIANAEYEDEWATLIDARDRIEALKAENKALKKSGRALLNAKHEEAAEAELWFEKGQALTAEIELLRKALGAAPLISAQEDLAAFKSRQDEWLRTEYRAAHHPECEDATGAYPGSCTCAAIKRREALTMDKLKEEWAMKNNMTVEELVALITSPSGKIYPFSYAANMMAAHGVNQKLVEYFHDAAAWQNRMGHDRNMILSDFIAVDEEAGKRAKIDSFLRHNPHVLPADQPQKGRT
jgi:hypothetical protein